MTEPSFGTADDDVDDVQTEERPHEVTTNEQDTRARRTLFSGTFKDALAYLRNNYPRLHVQPGGGNPVADAVLRAPDGTVFEHHGEGAVGADDNGLVKQEGNE